MPVFAVLGILTGVIMGCSMPTFDTLLEFLSRPVGILPYLVWIMVYGPLPEELGWCGYELDRLQARYSVVAAQLTTPP